MFGTVDWNPQLTQRLGADVSTNIGVFSDLRTFTTNSLRFFGRGLLTFQVTPTVQVKGGVEHFDRLSLKTLPAGGILWTPNPDVKFDIYFPQPKLAQRLTTLGNTDIWWYVGGEYGGGSWTVERTIRNPADMGMPGPTFSEQVDINDLRVLVGLEWFSGVAAIKGFVEAGYVFDREIVFRRARFPTSAMMPADNTQTLKDTFMIRGGLSY